MVRRRRRFNPETALCGVHTPASLGQLLADADQGGYDVEPVWIVTDMGPLIDAQINVDFRRLIVPIPAPLAPHGTAPWAQQVRWGANTTVSRCSVTHNGPRCDRADGRCTIYEAQQAVTDGPAGTWSTEPPSDAERALMDMLRGRPDPRDASSWGRE